MLKCEIKNGISLQSTYFGYLYIEDSPNSLTKLMYWE